MLFKILFIISLSCAYSFINKKVFLNKNMIFSNKKIIYNTIIYDNNNNFGSEYDSEMSEEEKSFHKEIRDEEEYNKYITDIITLQKYQTMYKLLKYLLDHKLNTVDKLNLLKIFKKEIDNKKW